MPTYKTTHRWYESGIGYNTDILAISDTYDGITDLSEAIEVGVFMWESTRRELDIDTGVYNSPELSFDILSSAVENMDDSNAVLFALAARDPAVKRYVARIINPPDPEAPTAEDVEFRGVLDSSFSGTDNTWLGPEYSGDISPETDWKSKSLSYEVSELFGMSMEDAVYGTPEPDAIPPEEPDEWGYYANGIGNVWKLANVHDEPGYFHSDGTGDGMGYRDVRFAGLVRFDVLVQKIIDQATAGLGVAVTYVVTESDYWVWPARFNAAAIPADSAGAARRSRFLDRYYPIKVWTDGVKLRLGGDIDGSMYSNWRMLRPTDEERSYSWLRYESVAEWLYSLAAALHTYVYFDYIDSATVNVSFAPPAEIRTGPLFIKDGVKADIDMSAEQPDTEKRQRYSGAAWQMNGEGEKKYRLTETGLDPWGDQIESGELLAVTVSPTLRGIMMSAGDAKDDIVARERRTFIPHNAIFYDDDTDLVGKAADGDPRFNASALHSAIYIRTHGSDEGGEVGTVGLAQVLPVARVALPDADGNVRETSMRKRLADLLNEVTVRNDFFFESEYKIDVPGLSCFRYEENGADDWRNLKLGGEIALRGSDWIVQAIDRKRTSTSITLHYASQFPLPLEAPDVFTSIAPGPALDDVAQVLLDAQPDPFSEYVAGGTIAQHDLVALNDSGLLMKATAHHGFHGKIVGMALEGATAGDMLRVVRTPGRVTINAVAGFESGNKLYLRTGYPGATNNYAAVALAGATATEDLYYELGYMESDTSLALRPGIQFVFYPMIEDE